MRFITRSSIAAFVICLVALSGAVRPATAQQTTWDVSNAAELTTALAGAFNNNVSNPSLLNTITLTGSISGSSQWIVNANVNIVGGGFTIDMQNADRAFFIAGGTVGISNLTIKRGNAVGGSGGVGGGGGAGLGGAIFVGSGTYAAWDGSAGATGISVPTVTLSAVHFQNNQAVGGSSVVTAGGEIAPAGGGGGMGGNGGSSVFYPFGQGAGGGGFGNGATGGYFTADPQTLISAGDGALFNVSGSNTSGGYGGPGALDPGYPGGSNGGGGGSGSPSGDGGGGGGGGVGGDRGYFQNDTPPNGGGSGGFGGGGGGSSVYSGGVGGFGGGGGAGLTTGNGGAGGFGGGGGAILNGDGTGGPGGFGAGHGANMQGAGGGGGGGLGAGGAMFVMAGASVTVQSGSFTNNAVTSGTGYYSGSAYGADLFLGGTVVFSPTSSMVVNSLGGAGNTSDANITNNVGLNLAGDPNANGGLIKTGVGTLTLTGTSYYSGITTVHSGTLAIAPGAMEQGTTVVTVAQYAGDTATLALLSSSVLNLAGFNGVSGTDSPLMIARDFNSAGTVVIGSGPGTSGADIGARVFTGGAGNATVQFTQQYHAGSASNPIYPFYTTLTGRLGIVQDGVGTTLLQPLYGANTFTGPVTVNSGTLATAGPSPALEGTSSITVNTGGTLVLGQTDGIEHAALLTLAGGVLRTGTSLTDAFGALNITGAGSIIDFLGTASTLNFSTLTLGGPLAIWNYNSAGTNDFLNITSGTATGSLAQIQFFSDSGSTFLGWGGFEGTRLVPVPVPEPSTIAMALAGLACGGFSLRRQKRARLPVARSPSRRLSSGRSGHEFLAFDSSVFSSRKGTCS